jgi:cytochrome c oxidase assembly protein subunit 15
MSTAPVTARRRFPSPRSAWAWLGSPDGLRVLVFASVIVNVAIVVTGGAVRLTSSGLGCPTWPRCTHDSLVPTAAMAGHGKIEFTNRMLTFAVELAAVLTLIAAVRQRPTDRVARKYALLVFLGIPAQAILGGMTVLTGLNPWLVGTHFLLSIVLIALSYRLLAHVNGRRLARRSGPTVVLGQLVLATTAAVLVIGTIVTGSGPHAGATDDDGVAHRNGLSPSGMSQLHADAVMILIGLTIGLLLLAVATNRSDLRRAAIVLLTVEAAQGLIGFVQYFTHLPVILVGFHMLGACLVWIACLRVQIELFDADYVRR